MRHPSTRMRTKAIVAQLLMLKIPMTEMCMPTMHTNLLRADLMPQAPLLLSMSPFMERDYQDIDDVFPAGYFVVCCHTSVGLGSARRAEQRAFYAAFLGAGQKAEAEVLPLPHLDPPQTVHDPGLPF